METMKKELKDAFRVYDKEGQGFITTETLRGLIGELLAPLTDEELEGIIEELDEDGSGSMDFDEIKTDGLLTEIYNIFYDQYNNNKKKHCSYTDGWSHVFLIKCEENNFPCSLSDFLICNWIR